MESGMFLLKSEPNRRQRRAEKIGHARRKENEIGEKNNTIRDTKE